MGETNFIVPKSGAAYTETGMAVRTALVLSAGGMFGAYQAGAWRALEGRLRPDIVIGASAGALNAWAIAGGCSGAELAAYWLEPACRELATMRPWRPRASVFHPDPLHARIRALFQAWRPLVDTRIVAIELPRLHPRVFRAPEVGWRHLAASCAVLLLYPQIRIGGRWYTDGGLLGALPLWAAAEAGAGRVIAIDALPRMPSSLVRTAVGAFRAIAPPLPAVPPGLDVRVVAPRKPLGSVRDALFWRRDAATRWIEMGERDAACVQ